MTARYFHKKHLFHFLLVTCFVLTSQSVQAEDFKDRIEGEWVNYRGDQVEIRTIKDGKETTRFLRFDGKPLFSRTANIKLTSESSSAESLALIQPREEWEYLAGGDEPKDQTWTGLGFDAEKAGWKTGEAGFGYGDNDDRTVLNDMQDNYTTIFVRKEFEIPEGTDLKRLGLLINYDDGFAVYANGRRLMTSNNVTIDEETGDVSVNDHEANGAEYFSLGEYASAFRPGKNVIAIQGYNRNLTSTDFTLDPQLIVGGSGSFAKTNRTEKHEGQRSAWFHNDRAWNGKIDDVIIWDRALSDEEVSSLWNRGEGSKDISSLNEGLLGHWPFDGSLEDVSGNNRHGKGYNSPGFAKGKLGQSLDLNGKSQFVMLGGEASDYAPESGSLTVSLWFDINKLDKRWQTLLSLGDGSWTDWRIFRQQMTPNVSYIGGAWVRNNTKVDDGKMHHLVAITDKENDEVRLYIDNVLVANTPNNGVGDLSTDNDGWHPAVGANLQQRINLATDLEGEFLPSQDSLRIVTKPSEQPQANRAESGLYNRSSSPTEALLMAARKGDTAKLKELLKSGVSPNATSTGSYTALSYAAAGGHLDAMKTLIAAGADVNQQARFGKSALLVAAGSPHVDAVKLLIENDADLDSKHAQGGNCLQEACFWGQPEVVEYLLSEHDMNPNARANGGRTALHYAMWSMLPRIAEENNPRLECMKLLLESGADPELRWNRTSAREMAQNNHLDEAAKLLP